MKFTHDEKKELSPLTPVVTKALREALYINKVTLYGDSPIRSLIESNDPDLLIFGIKKGANLYAGHDSGWGFFWKSYLEIIINDNNFGVETINLLLKLDLLKIHDMRNEDYSSFKEVIINKLEKKSENFNKKELQGLYEEVLSRRYLQKTHLNLFWQGLKSINKLFYRP